jgi:hypothetical protein
MSGISTAMTLAGVVLAMFALTVAAQMSIPAEKTCGPPNYCARTDVRVES